MKTVQVELSDNLAVQMGLLIEKGWFIDEKEIMRLALIEYIRRHKFALLEQFQLEDIAWAKEQRRLD